MYSRVLYKRKDIESVDQSVSHVSYGERIMQNSRGMPPFLKKYHNSSRLLRRWPRLNCCSLRLWVGVLRKRGEKELGYLIDDITN